ncbi:MAG: heme lyase CcmF/NrfE family subunit, partial [Bryobacteraceae bacterium]|nr:heme lyase CcmF/NrfE family subunit [Bryobacteraceae bacterium]
WNHAVVEVRSDGKFLGALEPERRFYKSSGQSTSEVAIRRRLNEDLYLNYAGVNENQKPVIQAYIFPLVSWIWIGFATLIFGTAICLVPSKVRLQYARTEVVGMVGKHAPAEK